MNQFEIKRFKKESHDIVTFWKEDAPNGIFSSWYNKEFFYRTNKFCNIEQWMAYRKAVIFDDKETRDKVLLTKEPSRINFLSNSVKNFNQETWDFVKYNELFNGNKLKFSYNEQERFALFETLDALIMFASPYDNEYGMGMSEKEIQKAPMSEIKNILQFGEKRGGASNLLGKALMEIRTTLKKESTLEC